MVKPLTVYKASAGSGKTFTLAVEYIKLLVLNPQSYRTILAVTFTNKATEEMKMRILSQLYGIWKQLPDSVGYARKITDETGFSDELLSRRAGEALHLLLHNYNYFRVETIDSFFQSVLRNLARELDLTANLRIGLNDVLVEEQAVDQLIDSLTHTDVMLQWLLKYIMETISEDRSWNIIGQVKQFGRTIFRDYYKENSDELNRLLNDDHFLDGYMKQMQQIRTDAEERMKEVAESFFDTLDGEGLQYEELNYGKTGVAGFFLKLRNGQMDESIVGKRVTDCMDDASKWYSKKNPRAEHIHMVAESSLIPILRYAVDERPRQWKLYKSADLTLRHLNQLRLLGSIEQKVRTMNEEANRFLLSDTQQLLHALIKDSDSPFIFEKIGTQLEHVMIDEFQDTSTVQWQNFKVLLQECMSHVDTENLIVGDVKQSIYRWRSGDWRLLNAIDREFPHSNELMDIRPLDTNYRSDRRIVTFNNAFFTEAAKQEYEAQREDYPQGAEQLRSAYADVQQLVPDGRPDSGYASISLLPQDDYQEHVLSLVVDTVRTLLAQGMKPGSMAILVRTNNYIPMVADYFTTHLPDVRIVSDEAFRLDSSLSVTLLVQALHLLAHPDDQLARATVAKIYQRAVLNNTSPEDELLIKDRPLDTLLPEAFTLHNDELLRLPLYELTERLYAIFQLDRLNEQSAYVSAFYDQLNQFAQDNSTDIDAFIREWDETLCRKTIQSAVIDGIRILSIHKSKGLEFDHVIIPFCDWRLEHADVLWCRPQTEPFNSLPIVPVDYSGKQMKGTIYEHDYLDEHLQNTVDNLNLLYVAFTRACRSLFVIGRRNSKATRSALIETVLPQLDLDGATLDGMEQDDAPLTFTYGTPVNAADTVADKRHTDNVFLLPVTPRQVTIQTFDVKTEFRQSNKSREFIESEDGDDGQQPLSYIKLGSVLHEVFSTIRTRADIDRALQRLQHDGVLYDDEVTRDKVTAMLHKRLKDPRVSDWFSGRWALYNECSILTTTADGSVETRRPDRVMTDGRETHVVDFKFGRPRPEYHDQVREYMQLLRSMGHQRVSGWLWYVYSNKIVRVE
ncbi:MAG: UvrD-helicase domain-containing protein [Prevotella sp.]|nr:UvrD-helicase domain-containing protein [Prevotella sp.]